MTRPVLPLHPVVNSSNAGKSRGLFASVNPPDSAPSTHLMSAGEQPCHDTVKCARHKHDGCETPVDAFISTLIAANIRPSRRELADHYAWNGPQPNWFIEADEQPTAGCAELGPDCPFQRICRSEGRKC